MDSPVIDQQIFTTLKDLLKDSIKELIIQYLKTSLFSMNTIESGIQSGNMHEIATAAHTLKSSSKQLGAVKFAELIIQLETAANESNTPSIPDIYAEAKIAYSKVMEALEQLNSQ
jgi:HPt (histidine-containing phosphotransfer) domain-containing protein